MKPTISLFVAALLSVSSSKAQLPTSTGQLWRIDQSPREHLFRDRNDGGQLPLPFDPSQQKMARKSTSAVGSRLIASTNYRYDSVGYHAGDSIAYFYSGSRGGDLETEIKCDSSLEFSFDGIRKVVNTYNAKNNIVSSVAQRQNTWSPFWAKTTRITWLYDASDKVTSVSYEKWESGAWVDDIRLLYVYTANNLPETVTSQYWTPWTTTWDNVWRDKYTYVDGNKTMRLGLDWNSTTASWDTGGRNIYTYSEKNELLTDTHQRWYGYIVGWRNDKRTANQYFLFGSKAVELLSYWDIGEWKDYERTLFGSFLVTNPSR